MTFLLHFMFTCYPQMSLPFLFLKSRCCSFEHMSKLSFSDDSILIYLQTNSMGIHFQKFSKVHNYLCNKPYVQINVPGAHSIAIFPLGSINVSCSLSWWMIRRVKCWFTSLSGWEDQPCKYSSHCSTEMNSIRSCPSNAPLAWGISHINF